MGLHSLFYSTPATQRRGLYDYALQHHRHDGRKCRNRSRFAMETEYTHSSMSRVEKRRSDGSLPVAIGGAFAAPPQSGLT